MDKSVLSAIVSSITKEEFEKYVPEIRNKIKKEVSILVGTKSFNKQLRVAIADCIERWLEDGLSDLLDNSSIERVIKKTVNKIVGR